MSGFVQQQRGRRDNTILPRQTRLLSFQNKHFLYFLTIKALWLKSEKFSTRRLCQWRPRETGENRRFIAAFARVNAF